LGAKYVAVDSVRRLPVVLPDSGYTPWQWRQDHFPSSHSPQIFTRAEEKTLLLPMEDTADAMDVVVTAPPAPTASTANTSTTTTIAKPKAKVKKELTTTEREVKNQKWQARRVAERSRKGEALAATLGEEKRGHLTIMAAQAEA
jgi:hypothetical protein